MTTPHDKALSAGINACPLDYFLQDGERFIRCSVSTADLEAMISAYLSSIGGVVVPVEPTDELLRSMAIRYDHGLGVPGYYDQRVFGAENVGHARRMESTIRTMRQLHEEVVGKGFYQPPLHAPIPEAGNGGDGRSFAIGDRVRKTKGSSWQGKIVGFYSTELTPVGYCVESEREPGSVQIYPEGALERFPAPPSRSSDGRGE